MPEFQGPGECPHCGHRVISVNFGGVGILDAVVTEIGYGVEKSWREQWGQVERSYKKLQELYETTIDNQEAVMVVKNFFIHSWHLADWLTGDKETTIKWRYITALMDSEIDMKICNAMANTAKHHTRFDKEITARVSSMKFKPNCVATIEVAPPGESAYARDALELAESCMDIWRGFLRSHGLTI